MPTARLNKRRRGRSGLDGALPTAAQAHKAPEGRMSAADRFRTGTVLCDWLMTVYEKAQAAASLDETLDSTSATAVAQQEVTAQVTALETLGLLLAAGLGGRQHLDVIASKLNDEDVRIREAALSAFRVLPAHCAVPHLDSLFHLLAGENSLSTRDSALTILERVPRSNLEAYIHVKLRGSGIWRKLGWVDWACGLWAMTALSSRALSRQLVTVARALHQIRQDTLAPPDAVRNASKAAVAQWRLLDKLRKRGKAPKSCDDWWSEGEVVALVRLLNEPHGAPGYEGVWSVLLHIDPTALYLGVPVLLDLALKAQEDCAFIEGACVALRALNVFAYPSLQSEKAPPPPPMIAQSIAGALRSKKASRRAAAAHAVGLLHRRLAQQHYPKLWELLNDRDKNVRRNSGDALRNGAGAVEVHARLKQISRKLKDCKTHPHELSELIRVLGALSKPWPSHLAFEVIRLSMSDDDTLAESASDALSSFSGKDLSAAFAKTVAEAWRPDICSDVAEDLLAVLDEEAFEGFIEQHVDFVAKCLYHSVGEVRDSALDLLSIMSVAARRPHLAAVATAVMRQPGASPTYVKLLGASGSGLAVSDLAPIIEALGSASTRVKALMVLRGLKTYHSQLLRTIMSPVARCLTDTEDLVRVMALRVMKGANVKELESEDVHLVADQLLHADDRIRQEAMVVINLLTPVTLWRLSQWLVEQLLHVPQHNSAVVTCVQRLLTRVPHMCNPENVEAIMSALESGCATTQATAIDTLMALKVDLLEPVMPRMEALISQVHVPAALKGAIIRIALRLPAAAHTSALADAVVVGMSDEEYWEVREVCVEAIEVLRYSMLRERARTVVSTLLKTRPLRLVERGGSLLMKRAKDRENDAMVVEHLGTVLQAVHDAECLFRRDAAFVLAKCLSDLCVRLHADALGRLLHHRDIDLRRRGFTIVASGYERLCRDDPYSFSYSRLDVAPPLVDTVADALCDSDEAVRTSAQEAMSSVLLHFPSRCALPRATVLASLLDRRCLWQPHRASRVARGLFKELREKLEEGDEAARVKILRILSGVNGDEMPVDLLKAIKRVLDEGSLSVRLAAAHILEGLPQPHTEAFNDGYMSLDFDDEYGSGSDDDEPSEYSDDEGDY